MRLMSAYDSVIAGAAADETTIVSSTTRLKKPGLPLLHRVSFITPTPRKPS